MTSFNPGAILSPNADRHVSSNVPFEVVAQGEISPWEDVITTVMRLVPRQPLSRYVATTT